MLELLLTILLLTSIITGFGQLLSKIGFVLWDGISSLIISGTLVLTAVFTLIGFFAPIDYYIEMLIVVLGLVLFVKQKTYLHFFNFYKNNDKYWITPLFFILFSASFSPFILDHFGYYVPTITWLSNFGITKGLVNLDLVLAQSSFWHILQTGFSHSIDGSFRLNILVCLSYVLYIFEKKQWNLLVFLPLFYFFLQSPSPDLPVMAWSVLVLNEFLKNNKNIYSLFTLSTFLFCIKPTLVWLPFFALILIFAKGNFKIKKTITAIGILLLFVTKNYVTFGFPIVPVQIGDLNLDWKPNQNILDYSAKTALLKTYDLQYTFEEISKFSIFDYIWNWLTLKGIKSIINIAFVLSLIGFTIYTWMQKRTIIRYLWLAIVVKSILVVIFSAQYRFFLDVFIVIGFLTINNLPRKISVFIFYLLSFAACSVLTYPSIIQKIIPSFFLGKIMKPFDFKQIIEPSVYHYQKYTTHTIGNMVFHLPYQYPYIFDLPSPAITPFQAKQYLEANIFPQWTGQNGIFKTIVHKNMTSKQAQELTLILEKYKQAYPSKNVKTSD